MIFNKLKKLIGRLVISRISNIFFKHFKSIVVFSFFFFICSLEYYFILWPDIKQKEKIYFNFQSSKKQLNELLKTISRYSNSFQKVKSLKQKFCLNLFQKNFLKRTSITNNQTQGCNYNDECKLIRNFETNLNMKGANISDSNNKSILHLLHSILTKYFIQSYQIKILDIRKINFPNSYKINFSISNDSENNINFINEIVKLQKHIIIQSFKSQFPINFKKYFVKNNILLSIYLIPCFELNNSIFKLLKINKKYIISILENDILTKFPLNQIKFLGFLSDNKNKTYGIIGLPNKKICKIILGSYLGIEQALVIGIYPEKIIITSKKSNKITVLSN